MRRFGDEVLLHSQQSHPNIVQLIGVYYPPRSQLPMLVMEYLPLSLTQCLEREELPLQMKYSILLDVAKGLCYLHGKRPPIVHRDLTANNVLLTSSYSAKISDLGVSRLADTFKKHTLTTAPGNAMVMPPEALEDNPVYDHKLDVFSYGCLILHVLTGQFPEPTNQFVPEPRRRGSFKRVSEWDRRSSYIKNIPKENEFLPLAKDCLNVAPTGRPEMFESYQFVEKVLSNYPKIQNTIQLLKEKEAAEKNIRELDKMLKSEKVEKDKLKEQLSSQVTDLQNALSLKEKEFNNSTRVLKEIIRSRDEQLLKQQQANMNLLKKRESEMKQEYEAKLQTLTKEYEQQLSKTHEECEVRVLEIMKEFTVKSSETFENTVVPKHEECVEERKMSTMESSEACEECVEERKMSTMESSEACEECVEERKMSTMESSEACEECVEERKMSTMESSEACEECVEERKMSTMESSEACEECVEERKMSTMESSEACDEECEDEECEPTALEEMKTSKSDSSETLESADTSKHKISPSSSSLQSLPIADTIPSFDAQKQFIHPLLTQRLKKGDKWLV